MGIRTVLTFCILSIVSTLALADTDTSPVVKRSHVNNASSVIKIAADHNYPPYEFLNENGEATGYTVELTQAIAQLMGFKIEITMTDWQSALAGLYSGKYDALQGIAYSEERANSIIFSSPHSIVNQSIFARIGTPSINNVFELKGKNVLVQNASIMHEYLLENNIGANIIPVQTHVEALRQLSSGKYDYALIANLPSLYLSKEFNLNNIQPIASPVAGQRLGYGALPGNEELIARFSEGLAILKNTGKQQEIYDKWLGTLEQPNLFWKKVGQYASYTIAILILILFAIIIWNTMLRKEVEKRTIQIKTQQEQLIQADKMASLGVLVSGVAHEINNPTGLLMLNLPLLQEAWEDTLPYLEEQANKHPDLTLAGLAFGRIKEELPHIMNEMNQSTLRIRNIVNDLKDFARSEPEAAKDYVNLNDTVSTAVRLVDKSIRNATDQFQMHLDGRNPIILGSAQRIEQIMINLIMNACDSLDSRQARIRLTTSLSLNQKEVYIILEDQGKGIDKEHISRLTDPFFTTKRDIGGTGLGLSVTSGIIASHEGSLSFDSELGKGTTVVVTFPLVANKMNAFNR